jgi:hypothetical protein
LFNTTINPTTGSSSSPYNLFQNTNYFNSNFSQLTKDFEAQYLIRANGDLSARYSYRVLNSTTLSTLDQLGVEYVNGVGLIYQRDFDTFGEFLRNFFKNHEKKDIPIKQKVVPTPATQTPAPAPVNTGKAN